MTKEPVHCESDDGLLEKWTSMRFVVMGLIMLARNVHIRNEGLRIKDEKTWKEPFKHHPKLTRWMNESSWPIAIVIAGVIFIQSEGVGLVIYFATSALMDNYTIYFYENPNSHLCEYTMQVSLYSMALVTFLPTVLVAYLLQGKWYEKGEWLGFKTIFILVMMATTCVSFVMRLYLVFQLKYDQLINDLLTKSINDHKVLVAILIPPTVDALQTMTLIGASLIGSRVRKTVMQKPLKYTALAPGSPNADQPQEGE